MINSFSNIFTLYKSFSQSIWLRGIREDDFSDIKKIKNGI